MPRLPSLCSSVSPSCGYAVVAARLLSARCPQGTFRRKGQTYEPPISRGSPECRRPSVRRYAHAGDVLDPVCAASPETTAGCGDMTPAAITRSTVLLLVGRRFLCSRLPDTYRRRSCCPLWKARLSRTRFVERL